MKTNLLLILLILFALLWTGVISAQQSTTQAEPEAARAATQDPGGIRGGLGVPRLIKFSGAFRTPSGAALTGVHGVTLALYKDRQGGSPLWLESQNVELDEQGRYTVLLGATKSDGVPLDLFATDEPRWLGVQMQLPGWQEGERALLVSVPYAMKAAEAETLSGLPLSSFVLNPEAAKKAGREGGAIGLTAATTLPFAAVSGTGTTNQIPKWLDGAGTLGDSTITDTGSAVGVGTTSPNTPLHVKVSTTTDPVLKIEGANITDGISLKVTHPNAVIGFALAGGPGHFFGTAVQHDALVFGHGGRNLLFGLGGSEFMRVAGSGNIGIGTTTPAQKLDVSGNIVASGAITATSFTGDGTTLTGIVQLATPNTFTAPQNVTTSGGPIAISGSQTAISGGTAGVLGESLSTSGRGVSGVASAGTGATYGVYGESASTTGVGVYGTVPALTGVTFGGNFTSASTSGTGLFAQATAPTGTTFGGNFYNFSTSGKAVNGYASATSGTTYGVYGQSTSTGGIGVYGYANAATGGTHGVQGLSASSDGKGVSGMATALSGTNFGVFGQSDSTTGRGVRGYVSAPSGGTHGVQGVTASTDGRGVYGFANSATGPNYGGYFESASTSGTGVSGLATASSGTTYGGLFRTDSVDGIGVRGEATPSTGQNVGVLGSSGSSSGRGVYGQATRISGATYGVYGSSVSTSGTGIYGIASADTGANYGGYFESASSTGKGVYGYATAASGISFGVWGQATSPTGTGVFGYATATSGITKGGYFQSDSTGGAGVIGFAGASTGSNAGVQGTTQSPDGNGVYGHTESGGSGYGVYSSGNAYVAGNLTVTGSVSKSGGSFKIDHPLDPANKYLSHSFVESPDMMNIYNGNVVTDANGEASVVLPEYFEALNRDFRYQLTVIGQFAQVIVAQEISNGRFTIKTDKPNVKVSWQVTGVRQDAWAEAHRIQVEEEKPQKERGLYLYPQLYGQPKEQGIVYVLHRRFAPEKAAKFPRQ